MSEQWLVLVPSDPTREPVTVSRIRAALRACGFVAERVGVYGATHECPGPRFLELLRFTDPPPAGQLWAPHTIEIRDPTERIEFLGGADTEAPSCPECTAVQDDWPRILSEWYEAPDEHRWVCAACSHECPVWGLDWRHTAGFGQQAIAIWHAGYQAAVPTQELSAVLQSLGAGHWTHFGCRI